MSVQQSSLRLPLTKRIQLWFGKYWKMLAGLVVLLAGLMYVLDYLLYYGSRPRPVAPPIISKHQTEYFGPSNTARVRGALKTNFGMGETQYYFAWESDQALETRVSEALDWGTCRREKVTDPKTDYSDDFVCAQYVGVPRIGVPRTRIWNNHYFYMTRFCPFFQVPGDLFEHAVLSTTDGFIKFYRSLDQRQYCVEQDIL